jgi:dihydropteroate synthase
MRPPGDPGPPVIMGVVNVTPDSFSDGGRWFDADAAISHGLDLVAEGATVVDVGGESTRPFATPVDPTEEQRRVLPVISALAPHVRVSVDTRNADTALAAIDAGATLLNDVSAGLARVAADAGVGWVAMHMQGDPQTMQIEPAYDDVVGEVRDFLVQRADEAVALGVDEVWIDPGFGFGKTVEHNLALLGHLDALVATGYPVTVGLSRKGFLGRLVAASDARVAAPPLPGLEPPLGAPAPVPADDRLEASVAAAVWALAKGARMVRVHDVAPTVRAARLLAASSPVEASWSAA